MKIGVPKEIKPQENRIGLTPESVKTLVSEGHEVLIENNGGFEAGFENEQYTAAGAKIVDKASDIFNDAEIIVKVKEPQKIEVDMIRENQIVYTYLHLAAAKELTEGLIKSKSINIAYETVTDDNGRLPLLAPMSAVAGRMSVQAGAHCLEKNQKGRGLLLGGAPGVTGGTVVILGGGVVGENAAVIATGMQAKVHIVDKSEARLKQLMEMFGDKIIPEQSDKIDLNKLVAEADLLIGGVLIPGAEAPKLITKDMLKLMKRGSVIVDVAIDQGGCVETSKPTTHGDPTYIVDDVVHYCVANMPGGVPRTSTLALNNATLPFLVKLANKGYQKALGEDKNFLAGLNVHKGQLTSGTTWHAAGLVGQLGATATITKLRKYSLNLYKELEKKTELATGLKQNGAITVASSKERLQELLRQATSAQLFDVNVEVLDKQQIKNLYPVINDQDILGGVYMPEDGQADPVGVTNVLAKAAKMEGVQIFEKTPVTKILLKNNRIIGVETSEGKIDCEYVVLATGMWSRQIGEDIGVSVPLYPNEHFYIITEPMNDLPKNLPVLRDYNDCLYLKEDAGKMLVGIFEPGAKNAFKEKGVVPNDFSFGEFPDDFDHFEPYLEKSFKRLPILENAGIRKFFSGPESFTPDTQYLLGETPEVSNLFTCCGFNSIGIASSS